MSPAKFLGGYPEVNIEVIPPESVNLDEFARQFAIDNKEEFEKLSETWWEDQIKRPNL